MKFKDYIPTLLLICLLLICLVFSYLKKEDYDRVFLDKSLVVPTLVSDTKENAIWACSFQLVWNNLKELNGDNITLVGGKENRVVKELNLETFKKEFISSDSYYLKLGFMTPSLKKEIETDIQDKFKQNSNILNEFNFQDDSEEYLLYSMLVKDFKFKYPFDVLTKSTFGIENGSDKKIRENVKVLYYENAFNYAVIIETESNEEVILAKGLKGENFEEMYNEISLLKEEDFKDNDTLVISKLNFQVKKDYSDLKNLEIKVKDKNYTIGRALQLIEFNMDNKGGKVKTEAGLELNYSSDSNGRHFNFKDDFTMFIKEKDKEKPYLAIKVKDIDKFN